MADVIIYNQRIHRDKIITIRKVRKEFHPNAVDMDLFKPMNLHRKGNFALLSDNLDRNETLKELKKFNDLTILDKREKTIPYEKMPETLNQYEMFIDHKVVDYGLHLKEISRTGLEALACGCKVYHDGKIIEKLPEEHIPEIVIKKLYLLFYSVLTKGNHKEKNS